MLENGIDIYDLNTVRSMDVSKHAGVITIEELDTDDPFKTTSVSQLVLQFHDINMTMLGFVEPELEHVKKALFFAWEIDARLFVHCRAGVSRSNAIALAIAIDRMGPGYEQKACEWLISVRPRAQPNYLIVWLANRVLQSANFLCHCAN